MALTVQDCEQHLIHELGSLPSPDVRVLYIINQAGQALVNMHPWRFLNRLTENTAGQRIDFVSGQNYATLPTGFSEFVALEKSNGLVQGFQLTSYQDLMDMRAGTYPSTSYKTYGAIYYAGDANSLPQVRLALHPTPTANQTNAVIAAYRIGWIAPANRDDKSYLQIPEYMELLYLTLLRGLASAIELKDRTITRAIDEVRASSLFLDALQRDAGSQRAFGPLENGAVARCGVYINNFPSSATADPS